MGVVENALPMAKDQGSWTKDHGPCFDTNGHPRRDTDVILRLSKCTIEYLSFSPGFTMEVMVEMMASDEIMIFDEFYEACYFFDPGINLGL